MPLQPEDYTVGWICALEIELVVACELLDEEYDRQDWPRIGSNQNSYHFGRIYDHNIAVACLPKGRYGITPAALVAQQMQHDFPSIQFVLMVGIGGGAPSEKNDIRLGDVVVSSPTRTHGGVLQYDFGKAVQKHEFEVTGNLAGPPQALLNALTYISAQHQRRDNRITNTVEAMLGRNRRLCPKYSCPLPELDRLFVSSYVHTEQKDCACNSETGDPQHHSQILINRKPRTPEDGGVLIHYGLIASANTLVKDAKLRDSLIKNYDVFCFETEAAGLMNDFPCIVIRGICDYSDSHKNDEWQGYAAANAAAYAKELLGALRGCPNSSRQSSFGYSQNEASAAKQQHSVNNFNVSDSAKGSSGRSFGNPPQFSASGRAENPYSLRSKSIPPTPPEESYFHCDETDPSWNSARQFIFQQHSDTGHERHRAWNYKDCDGSAPSLGEPQCYPAMGDTGFQSRDSDIHYDLRRPSTRYRPVHNPNDTFIDFSKSTILRNSDAEAEGARPVWKTAVQRADEEENIHKSRSSAVNNPRPKSRSHKIHERGQKSEPSKGGPDREAQSQHFCSSKVKKNGQQLSKSSRKQKLPKSSAAQKSKTKYA